VISAVFGTWQVVVTFFNHNFVNCKAVLILDIKPQCSALKKKTYLWYVRHTDTLADQHWTKCQGHGRKTWFDDILIQCSGQVRLKNLFCILSTRQIWLLSLNGTVFVLTCMPTIHRFMAPADPLQFTISSSICQPVSTMSLHGWGQTDCNSAPTRRTCSVVPLSAVNASCQPQLSE